MSVADEIADMLKSGDIDIDVALRLILEMLLSNREADKARRDDIDDRLADIEARQEKNPSIVWMFRNRKEVAVPTTVAVLLGVAWLSSFTTSEIIGRFLLGLLGLG